LAALLWILLALFVLRVAGQPRRFFAVHWLVFGVVYLGAMLARFAVQGPTIPVVFHWVLAAFVIAVGLWHRRRLRP
jgi:hypothetical protein